MKKNAPAVANNECSTVCASVPSIEALNSECFCIGVDQPALHSELDAVLREHGLPPGLADSHPHLFSTLPVYVSRRHIEQIGRVVTAIEEVAAAPAYRSAVLAWAPDIATFNPGSPGGLLGLDFHLGPEGPRLIEINTNPGGVLLNAMLGQALRTCMPELTMPPTDPGHVEDAVMKVMLAEWQSQRGSARLESVAIVDQLPTQQYLYPEFLLFRNLFRRYGYRAEICDPEALTHKQNRLRLNDAEVDFVYNRLTDFSLQEPAQDELRAAYLAGDVVVSPHPYAHALFADKRNLTLLSDREFLRTSGIGQAAIEVLMAATPSTRVVTPENRDAMWTDRRRLFFKPAAGFGSKASYRGDKLTRRVWDEIAGGTYVAQEIVLPSERYLAAASSPMKVDIRCYTYGGNVLLYAARMYQGQTTNFRTAGGGFAPVLTSRQPELVTT